MNLSPPNKKKTLPQRNGRSIEEFRNKKLKIQNYEEMKLEKDNEIKNLKMNLQSAQLKFDDLRRTIGHCQYEKEIESLVGILKDFASKFGSKLQEIGDVLWRNYVRMVERYRFCFNCETLSMNGKLAILLIIFLLIFKLCKKYFQQRRHSSS